MTNMLGEFWMPPAEELSLFAPELALVATIAALLVVPLFAGRSPYLTAAVAMCGVLATLVLTGRTGQAIGWRYFNGVAGLAPAGAPAMLIADHFSIFYKLLLLLFLSLVTGLWLIGLTAPGRSAAELRPTAANAPEFFVLLFGSALGMVLMVSTLNLLMIVLAIELASLPSYAIAGFLKSSRRSAEASLKYVIFGAATAAIMLYGVSLLYGCYGTLDLAAIARAVLKQSAGSTSMSLLLVVALVALFVGIGFKISAVPLHFWCPDVFEGAPIEVTTWLSVASKAAGLGLMMRIVAAFAAPAGESVATLWGPMAMTVGVFASLTCTVANFAAYRQDNVKRILAYSSIAHAGYMLMAAAVMIPAGEGVPGGSAAAALVSYLLIYLFMNLGAFGVTAIVSWQTGSESLSAFTGLGRRAPWLAVPMAVCLFSLVGLPPLGGFIAKWWLLYALGVGAQSQPWLWVLVVVLVLNTLFSLYYYARILLQMFLRTESHWAGSGGPIQAPITGLVLVNACAAMLIFAGTVGVRPIKVLADAYASRMYVGTPVFAPMAPGGTVRADSVKQGERRP